MARIETDPNYSSPTFPRATAATDLFKKGDVQALAEAVSTHNHSPGKGLLLPETAIGPNTIYSTHVVDGTLVGSDIADNTVQWRNFHPDGRLRNLANYATLLNWSTSAPGWVVTPISVTLPGTMYSHKHLMVQFNTCIAGNTPGNGIYVALGWNGSGPYSVGTFVTQNAGANYLQQASFMTYVSPSLSFSSFGIYVNGGGQLLTITNACITALNVFEMFQT